MRVILSTVGLGLLISQAQAQVPLQYTPFVQEGKICRFVSLSSTDVWLMALEFKHQGDIVFRSGRVTRKPATEVNDKAKTLTLTQSASPPRSVQFSSDGKLLYTTSSGQTSFSLFPEGNDLVGTMTVGSGWSREDIPAKFEC